MQIVNEMLRASLAMLGLHTDSLEVTNIAGHEASSSLVCYVQFARMIRCSSTIATSLLGNRIRDEREKRPCWE